VFDICKANNIEYTVFLHTFSLTTYSNIRTREKTETVNNDEYKLLTPDYSTIDDQDTVKALINLPLYRTHPDPWHTQYNSVDNFILAQYSKLKVVQLIESTNTAYDYVIFIRPDCRYNEPFQIDFLKNATDTQICIPNFHLYGRYNFNDRFCIATMATYKVYGAVFDHLLEISKRQSLHSETVLGQHITNALITIDRIPFRFSRIRCDGRVNDPF